MGRNVREDKIHTKRHFSVTMWDRKENILAKKKNCARNEEKCFVSIRITICANMCYHQPFPNVSNVSSMIHQLTLMRASLQDFHSLLPVRQSLEYCKIVHK